MTEREELIEEAKVLGIEFPKNIKTQKLREAVAIGEASKISEKAYSEASGLIDNSKEPVMTEAEIRKQIEAEYASKFMIEKAKLAANMEVNMALTSDKAADNRVSIGQAKLKSRRDAISLVRVNINCKDPMKSSWTGELISAGNDIVGDVTKYIQFDTEEGYHIPRIIFNVLKDKKCTHFVNKRINGQMTQVAKQMNAYFIQELPALTPEELEVLGRDQKARGAIDDE